MWDSKTLAQTQTGVAGYLEMAVGHVKWYSERKGFGYIETEEHCDLFFSTCNLVNQDFWKPLISDRVSFDVIDKKRGKQADRVKRIRL
jgi:CspA family cold shock protein